jgi:hypothetical protein
MPRQPLGHARIISDDHDGPESPWHGHGPGHGCRPFYPGSDAARHRDRGTVTVTVTVTVARSTLATCQAAESESEALISDTVKSESEAILDFKIDENQFLSHALSHGPTGTVTRMICGPPRQNKKLHKNGGVLLSLFGFVFESHRR